MSDPESGHAVNESVVSRFKISPCESKGDEAPVRAKPQVEGTRPRIGVTDRRDSCIESKGDPPARISRFP